ncbi:NADH:flavin oxidoreductase/NADH oxidase [Piptocephalis cylindrospora]|uniref:NADH:flavin oxidoreductase/NADH oxidase n=1 Tax=Piptocephalis cylindrospora TaxID=1907219 RepID=A0A4P9Y785_9FUNG|nr:NADH:flavin oxidoreductase/NADH oxidase [Piptocephalis cylindrospora]|eukprot:RKP14574.1 NADH:flavin oxidoreductase/NADH oxidase [Piptocephalis cylindrospora]
MDVSTKKKEPSGFGVPIFSNRYPPPGRPQGSKDIPALFHPYKLRNLTLKNRIAVSPMCMYSSSNGFFNDFHLVHIGSMALHGVGLITTEATAVAPEGRISFHDAGIWSDEHIAGLKRIVDFSHRTHTPISVQLAHAGRKASTKAPWLGDGDRKATPSDDPEGWEVLGASALPYNANHNMPHEMTVDQIRQTVQDFADAAKRVDLAGADVIELHFAHGYLASTFLSPISNHRTDQFGGSFENRSRLHVEIVRAVRAVWGDKPLIVRISVTEWVKDEPSWDIEESIKFSKLMVSEGVDLIDCSSGGISERQVFPTDRMDFQIPLAERIHREAGVPTGAVGFINDPIQANEIISSGKSDLVFVARELLRNPGWAIEAASKLGVRIALANQYARAGIHRPTHQ